MYLESLRFKLPRQVLKLSDARALITAQLCILFFLDSIYPKWNLLTCRLEQPLVLLLAHLVQMVHHFDLHLTYLLPC